MSTSLLRARIGHEHARVTYVELFFDLVFVFAITQLSHALLAHFTPIGAAQTALMLMAVWWVWVYTSWITNWLDPDKLPVRFALFAIMAVGLIMSASIPHAFEKGGLVFAACHVIMQIGRSLFMLWAVRDDDNLRRNFQRIVAWLVLAAPFWIGGALVEGEARLALWALALGIEYISPSLGFWTPGLGRSSTTEWNVEGAHMAERCALFMIIALGESILVIGATFSGLDWTPPIVMAFGVSFVSSLAMWWIYFNAVANLASRAITNSADPGRMARAAYTYLPLLTIAGVILTAVADEFVLAHPQGQTEAHVATAVVVGPALYLFGMMLFKRVTLNVISPPYVVGLAALAALIPLWMFVSPLVFTSLATLVLIAVAAADAIIARRRGEA